MKSQSDNFREASIMDIMRKLKLKGINIIIYEPILNGVSYCDYEVTDYSGSVVKTKIQAFYNELIYVTR